MTACAAVVPFNAFWDDPGSFDALHQLGKKDEDGNSVRGECLAINSNKNMVISDRLIATIGIPEMVIVDIEDVFLLCPKEMSWNVGEIVERLKKKGEMSGRSCILLSTVHGDPIPSWRKWTCLRSNVSQAPSSSERA